MRVAGEGHTATTREGQFRSCNYYRKVAMIVKYYYICLANVKYTSTILKIVNTKHGKPIKNWVQRNISFE